MDKTTVVTRVASFAWDFKFEIQIWVTNAAQYHHLAMSVLLLKSWQFFDEVHSKKNRNSGEQTAVASHQTFSGTLHSAQVSGWGEEEETIENVFWDSAVVRVFIMQARSCFGGRL